MESNHEKLQLDELNRLSVEEFKQVDKIPVVVVLDNVRSANNVGSVFRTSDAFRIQKVYLCGITCNPPHKDIQKTALGAQNSVEWEATDSTLQAVKDLKAQGFEILSIEQVTNSIMLHEFEFKKDKKYVLVFGNEVSGVDIDVVKNSDDCIEIPQYGTKHSLNISVSCGIVLWDVAKVFCG